MSSKYSYETKIWRARPFGWHWTVIKYSHTEHSVLPLWEWRGYSWPWRPTRRMAEKAAAKLIDRRSREDWLREWIHERGSVNV